MDTIVTVAQISVAVIQLSVAAALVGAATFSAWRVKHNPTGVSGVREGSSQP